MKPLAWNGNYMREAFLCGAFARPTICSWKNQDLPLAELKGQLISCVPADSY